MTANPTLLSMPLAQNGQKNTIPATQATAGDGLFSQSTGFPAETSLPLGAGGKAPMREDFNGAFNLLSDIAFYAQKGWFFKWDENQEYFAGCVVRDETDGYLYEAVNDVAAGGSVPSADSTNWKIFASGGLPIGTVHAFLQTSIPDGWLSCENGQEVSRTAYPELWAWVQDNAPLITEAQWQTKAAAQKSVGYYSDGDGSTTFRLPRLVGFMEGTTAANVGQFTGAGLPNAAGSFSFAIDNVACTAQVASGAVFSEEWYQNNLGVSGSHTIGSGYRGISMDLSRANTIYGASNTVQPESVGMVWCVRAFGAAVNQGTVDITELAQMLNLKAETSLSNLSTTGEDHFLNKDFTIIYPNGGSESAPANVASVSRYVESNPFPGYIVNCSAEILYGGVWGNAAFGGDPGTGAHGFGTAAYQLDNDSIVIQTGQTGVLGPSATCGGNPFGTVAVEGSLPCRVKVWKVGKVSA